MRPGIDSSDRQNILVVTEMDGATSAFGVASTSLSPWIRTVPFTLGVPDILRKHNESWYGNPIEVVHSSTWRLSHNCVVTSRHRQGQVSLSTPPLAARKWVASRSSRVHIVRVAPFLSYPKSKKAVEK